MSVFPEYNNDSFCCWNLNYLCKGGANISARLNSEEHRIGILPTKIPSANHWCPEGKYGAKKSNADLGHIS